jgi:hypothetical protein
MNTENSRLAERVIAEVIKTASEGSPTSITFSSKGGVRLGGVEQSKKRARRQLEKILRSLSNPEIFAP